MNDQLTREYPALGPLREAAKTYRDRRETYGPSERLFGTVMQALLGDKDFMLHTVDDFVRMGLLVQIVGKLCRYVADPKRGHVDSAHDLGVYAFMLEAEDRRIQDVPRDEHAEFAASVNVDSNPRWVPPADTYDRLYHSIVNQYMEMHDDLTMANRFANTILKQHISYTSPPERK